jgi:transcription initiation factor TFIIIB Brf1 subunit/transcription initiation factor TFIIB
MKVKCPYCNNEREDKLLGDLYLSAELYCYNCKCFYSVTLKNGKLEYKEE